MRLLMPCQLYIVLLKTAVLTNNAENYIKVTKKGPMKPVEGLTVKPWLCGWWASPRGGTRRSMGFAADEHRHRRCRPVLPLWLRMGCYNKNLRKESSFYGSQTRSVKEQSYERGRGQTILVAQQKLPNIKKMLWCHDYAIHRPHCWPLLFFYPGPLYKKKKSIWNSFVLHIIRFHSRKIHVASHHQI